MFVDFIRIIVTVEVDGERTTPHQRKCLAAALAKTAAEYAVSQEIGKITISVGGDISPSLDAAR